jgi:LPXTG-motif cell wall-anchored protein
VDFACTAASGAAAVTIDMMTDLHPAYRTLATGPEGQHAVYSADAAEHDWRLAVGASSSGTTDAGTGVGRSAAVQLGALLGALAVIATGGWLLRRRRRSATA